jgi:hypothetical protein
MGKSRLQPIEEKSSFMSSS